MPDSMNSVIFCEFLLISAVYLKCFCAGQMQICQVLTFSGTTWLIGVHIFVFSFTAAYVHLSDICLILIFLFLP